MNTIPCYDRFAPVKRFALLASIVLLSMASAGLIVHGSHSPADNQSWGRTGAASSAEQTARVDWSAIGPLTFIR